MALGWFDRKRTVSTEWSGFLEKGVKLEGKLDAPGTFRVDSHLKGSISAEETLILGPNAAVEGEIKANQVVVAGRFDGTIQARSKVEIQTKAIVTGIIHTPCLMIEPGAVFDGECHMLAPTAAQAAKPIAIPIRSAAQG
jgi:cytoskeletal protein CcmA (bactofilin family)